MIQQEFYSFTKEKNNHVDSNMGHCCATMKLSLQRTKLLSQSHSQKNHNNQLVLMHVHNAQQKTCSLSVMTAAVAAAVDH